MSRKNRDTSAWRLGTRVVHAGREEDPTTGAVVQPLHLATTFARNDEGELQGPYLYGRYQNPNRAALEECLASLEGGEAAAAFASGSAAANAVLQSLESNDRILYSHDLYHGVRLLMQDVAPRCGLLTEPCDLTDLQAIRRALASPVRLVWCETPTNPMLRVVDLAALAELTHAAGGLLLVDNTFATPAFQRPLTLGADLVAHSTTKYLAGHSDVTGGALVTGDRSTSQWERVSLLQRLAGAVPSPFDCWLTLRGISTLALRMRAHAENALFLARWLEAHPKVSEVIYPGLPQHSEHDVARRQMSAFGGMISFRVQGGADGASRCLAALTWIYRATSLGGVHTLIEHRAKVEPVGSPVPRDLIRLSVGIEDLADLTVELERGLEAV